MKAIIFFLLTLVQVAYIGYAKVRTLPMNDKKMELVRLSLGKSTILRFREKPKKIVLGNETAYKVDFIEKDMILQPKAINKTNLFVYTEKNIYGFLLLSTDFGEYDDLVNIRRKSRGGRYKLKTPSPLKIKISEVRKIKNGLFMVAFTVTNRTKQKIQTSNVKVFATVHNKRLSRQKTYFKKDAIGGGKTTEARLIVKTNKKKNLVLNLNYGNATIKEKIPWQNSSKR